MGRCMPGDGWRWGGVMACGTVLVGGFVYAYARPGLSPVCRPLLNVLHCECLELASA